MGRISGAFGIRGWVKLTSYTEPPENIFNFSPWYLTQKHSKDLLTMTVATFKPQQKEWAVQFAEIDDRDKAQALRGAYIQIPRELLPALQDEYYWIDLEGLKVINLENQTLGVVEYLFATGSNDVMMVKGSREHLIPFVRPDVVRNIDLDAKIMVVDWDSEF
jgi:16S rRNA processing protein RimM